MNQLDPKKPVSLEDLLHLKRAEQPPETFWLQFESELRAKQLAAIVERGPWWSSWRNILSLLARQSLPIGATAALALGLLSFHGYRAHPESSVAAVPPAVSSSSEAELDSSAGVSMDSVPDAPAETAVAESSSAEGSALVTSQSAGSKANSVTPAQAHAPVGIAAVGTADPFSALVGSPNHPAQPIAPQSDAWSHFGDQQLASNSLATTVGFAPHAFSAPISEPLAQMATPLDERRAMLLSGSLPRAENAGDESTALNSDDHSASHLSDDRLYESVSRLGVGGNRLSIRF
jgi:hypothetical protein